MPAAWTGNDERMSRSAALLLGNIMQRFKLALVINPIAGIGGAVGLKGSDGEAVQQQARQLGGVSLATRRTQTALTALLPYKAQIQMLTVAGDMGAELCQQMGFFYQILYEPLTEKTSPQDTQTFVELCQIYRPDLLLFAGGDGTARDICAAVDQQQAVLGIPAGCKIHSGVYAVTPSAAGQVVKALLQHQLMTLADADVMDIDEDAFRAGRVQARYYGEMRVPQDLRYVQQVKMGGQESEQLVLHDIAADVVEQMDDELWIIGSGTTVAAVMDELSLENTLLGVDLVQHKELVARNVSAQQIMDALQGQPVKLLITLIGGQGHLFGRGNQQLSPEVLRAIGRENIIVLATKTKLKSLQGRPLIVDTGDPELDKSLSGYIRVTTGYHDHVMVAVANPE